MPTTQVSANRDIFIAYPWSLYPQADYKKAYTCLESEFPVSFCFAEQRISTGHVLDKIITMIKDSAFGIYDVSSWNPNVTLEYGIARGMGADAFIAFNPDKTKKGDVPSDLGGYDRLEYADLGQLTAAVSRLIRQVPAEHPEFRVPIRVR